MQNGAGREVIPGRKHPPVLRVELLDRVRQGRHARLLRFGRQLGHHTAVDKLKHTCSTPATISIANSAEVKVA
jgi:hypothetical protein